jgi:hypothetical protein
MSAQPRKRKSKEPRKTRCPVTVVGTRLTSPKRIANTKKFAAVARSFDHIRSLKNNMSAMAGSHVEELWGDAYAFKRRYREFTSTYLNALERQTSGWFRIIRPPFPTWTG